LYENRLEKSIICHNNVHNCNRYLGVDFFCDICINSGSRYAPGENLIYSSNNKRWFFSCFVLDRNNSIGIDVYIDFNISFLFFNWIFKKTKETGLVSYTKSSVCLFFTSTSQFSSPLEESINMVLLHISFILICSRDHILPLYFSASYRSTTIFLPVNF